MTYLRGITQKPACFLLWFQLLFFKLLNVFLPHYYGYSSIHKLLLFYFHFFFTLVHVLLVLIYCLFLFTDFLSLARFPQCGFRNSSVALMHTSLDSCLINRFMLLLTFTFCDLHKALLCSNQIPSFPIIFISSWILALSLLSFRTYCMFPMFSRSKKKKKIETGPIVLCLPIQA